MSTNYEPEQFQIRIFDQSDGEHYVYLETLTHVLQGIQKAITVLAKEDHRLPTAKSLPTKDKKNYSLRCSVPQPGSYVIPIEFGTHESMLCDNPVQEGIKRVAEKFVDCLTALGKGGDNAFRQITDPVYRKQVLSAFRMMLPKPGAKWRLGIAGPRIQKEIRYSSQTIHDLKQLEEQLFTQEECELKTVTGYLSNMDFDGRCITLKYPPTQTELKCYYRDDLEVELFENRRELLQVTGNVTYSSDRETPKKIVDVEEIQFLDLSDYLLESFSADQGEIEFKEPLVLTPELTDSCQFITLRDERLGIDVIAQTREELDEELRGELRMLWEQSRKPDEKLGKVFLEQKRNLLTAIKEVE